MFDVPLSLGRNSLQWIMDWELCYKHATATRLRCYLHLFVLCYYVTMLLGSAWLQCCTMLLCDAEVSQPWDRGGSTDLW